PPRAAVAPEAKANTSDPDSRILRDGINYVQGYNAQAAVGEGQIIIAAELVQDTNDRHQLTPMLTNTTETLAAIGHDQPIGVVLPGARSGAPRPPEPTHHRPHPPNHHPRPPPPPPPPPRRHPAPPPHERHPETDPPDPHNRRRPPPLRRPPRARRTRLRA